MKKGVLVLVLILGGLLQAMACDISMSVSGNKKTGFKVGDDVLVDVKVVFIHHHCQVAIKDTKFAYDGLQVVGATDWKEIQPGTYTRQVKIKITESTARDAKLTAMRKCDKEGGYNVLVLKKA